jgi:mono/diheme cytochrome c family protein
MKKILISCFVALIYSCSPSLYKPNVSDPELQSSLMHGRKLYVSHCSNCHNLHLPKEFSSDDWIKQVNKMQTRAGISDSEKVSILNYLTYNTKK